MKIPKKIKIGGHIYKIILAKKTAISIEERCGLTSKDKGTILINSDLIESEQEATLFHEIFHIINNSLTEILIESLSQQLHQVFKDNKFLKD